MQYIVKRQHYGDKQYYAGDIRIVHDDFTAKKLIELGLIDNQPEEADKPKPRKKAES